MEENKYEEGVSLGEIFGWIWAKKILGLITTLLLFIVIVVGMLFIYNPGAKIYEVKFSYENIPHLANGSYVDGSPFNYKDLIKRSTVEETVKNNSEFSSVDLEVLLDSNDLTISEAVTYLVEDDPESEVVDRYLSIKAPYKAFTDDKEASAFLSALIMNPVNKDKELINNLTYDANFELMTSATSYSVELSYIDQQINLITSGYDNLIAQYGDLNIYFSNGEVSENNLGGVQYKLSQLKTKLTSDLNELGYYSYSSELSANGYIKNPELEKTLIANKIISLNKQKTDTETKITNLEGQLDKVLQAGQNSSIIVTDAIKDLVNEITSLTNQKVSLEIAIADAEKQQVIIEAGDYTASEEFGARLVVVEDLLKTETAAYVEVAQYVYLKDASVVYLNTNVVNVDGGFGTIIVLALGAFAGLFVGVIVAGIAGYMVTKKQEKELAIKKEN